MSKAGCLAKRCFLMAALGCALGGVPSTAGEEAPAAPVEGTAGVLVHVTLAPAEGTALAGEGFVVLKGPTYSSPVVLPTKLPGPVAVHLPPGSQWTLIADFPGYFAPNQIVQVPSGSPSNPVDLNVELRPAGTLSGTFFADEKVVLPDRLEARFEPTHDRRSAKQTLRAGLATCAVNGDGAWRCRVPAGHLDVALHPRGFVPHYLWNVAVEAGKTSTLEKRKLVRGASVAGWVAKEDGSPAEKCRVRLEPASGPGRSNDPVLEFLRSAASDVPCQKMGFFQFSNVAAGSYALLARDGDAQAQISPVEVLDNSETRISVPVTLRRPVDFEVTLSPPTDWLGRPWRFEARRAIEYRSGWEEPSFRAEAGRDGRVKLPRQAPGRFWITVYDGLGNAVFSDSHVDLADAGQPYPITLDLLWIQGRVRLGDEAVTGRLVFSGQSGAASISMTTDESGRFEGPLPKPGDWRVDVIATEPPLRAYAKVEVKPKGGSVSIELPNTRVYGRVVDPAGAPAPGARITFSSNLGTLVVDSDPKGEFEIRAFTPGTLDMAASRSTEEGRREVSDSYRFEAAEDSSHGPVVLALRRNQTVRGKVLAATGPVIGASVLAWSADGGDGVATSVRTRLDGSFEIDVPAGTHAVQVAVSPPGGALKVFEALLSNEAELLFQVEPLGGELVVSVDEEAFEGRILAVWQGDLGIPIGTLIHWTEGHGVRFFEHGQVRVPQLAPGFYTVCLGAPAVTDPGAIEGWKSRGACASGYLAAGSALGLRLK